MQEFKNAPENQDVFNRLGYAAAVCSGIIVVGTVIGVITETLPLQSMANAAIGQYLTPLLGEKITFFAVAAAVATFVIYLAVENIKAARAAFSTFNAEVRGSITFAGVILLWFIVLFVIITRISLTYVGSHQIAYMAITPPKLNTAQIAQTDSLHNIRNGETQKAYETQRQRLLNDNKQAFQAAKKLAIASEANALKEVKNAPNEYRKNIATQKLKEVRAANAERLAVVQAQGSQALLTLSAQQNNVLGENDSINNVAKRLTVTADAHAQSRYFWLSDKLTNYLPYISLFCVLLVTLAVFVLCLIERAAGITTRFEQGRYDNMPGLITVYRKAFADIWQSWNRAFVAALKGKLEKDIFEGNTVSAAAVGAGNTVQINGSGSVQHVEIEAIRTNGRGNNVITPVLPVMPPPEQQTVKGRVITLTQANAQLNAYKSYLAKGERDATTCKARIAYFSHLISEMKSKGVYEMVAPPFKKEDWV